jgi:hypothetical protein
LTLQVRERPTSLKAAWELLEIFYVDKNLHSWLPERLVDWLAVMLLLLTFSLFDFVKSHLLLEFLGLPLLFFLFWL